MVPVSAVASACPLAGAPASGVGASAPKVPAHAGAADHGCASGCRWGGYHFPSLPATSRRPARCRSPRKSVLVTPLLCSGPGPDNSGSRRPSAPPGPTPPHGRPDAPTGRIRSGPPGVAGRSRHGKAQIDGSLGEVLPTDVPPGVTHPQLRQGRVHAGRGPPAAMGVGMHGADAPPRTNHGPDEQEHDHAKNSTTRINPSTPGRAIRGARTKNIASTPHIADVVSKPARACGEAESIASWPGVLSGWCSGPAALRGRRAAARGRPRCRGSGSGYGPRGRWRPRGWGSRGSTTASPFPSTCRGGC